MKVWILEAGEDHEGGQVLGVYASIELAKADVFKEGTDLFYRFGRDGFDAAEQREDGSVYLHSGCDWLTLSPYEVVSQNAIES